MDSGSKFIPWSDLPKELLERIGKSLDTHIDVLCFRAVCTTWRSSLSPFTNSPLLPLEIPCLLDYPDKGKPGYHLIESAVYIFQPLDGASVASPCKGWLIKVIKTADGGKLRVLNPLTGRLIKVLPDRMPKVLNLLDFRVSQVCKSYHVQYFNPSRPSFRDYDVGHVRKILLLTNDAESGSSNQINSSFSLMAIDLNQFLCYLKSGDEKWTKLKKLSSCIEDIIVYKGNFYSVDRDGETMKFDSSFNETTAASRLCNSFPDGKKRLVESSGQLFLVDSSNLSSLEVNMYRLDEEQNRWIEVQTLGDRIFFTANDCCFSVSSRDLGECKGNCIYYVTGGVYYDAEEDSDDDMYCCYCGFSDDDPRPVAGDDYEISYPINNDDHKINDSTNKSGGDDVIGTSISNDDQKINESGSKSGPLREEQLANRYEGVFDHNTCVFTIEDGKLGSLLSFLDYAEILWPPPSWLNSEDQLSHAHEIAQS